ncbi:MAG: group II truncated hemoglobin [Deltaproteobacteria bacterium]|nr:group II truncated hemoglobin [Deltaproteobacteria bacterium]
MTDDTSSESHFAQLGGEPVVRSLVELFYDAMDDHEPVLAALHKLDANQKVSRESRDRFALFLIGWLGGPQTYMALHGHPRLRMRHAHVPVDRAMRDAWMRAMDLALAQTPMQEPLRVFLHTRFAEIADFLRNVREPEDHSPNDARS